jgi:hypothetical protein
MLDLLQSLRSAIACWQRTHAALGPRPIGMVVSNRLGGARVVLREVLLPGWDSTLNEPRSNPTVAVR